MISAKDKPTVVKLITNAGMLLIVCVISLVEGGLFFRGYISFKRVNLQLVL